MSEIDPVEYGRLLAAVEQLEKKMDKMEDSIDSLIELANKSKGGFWVGMTIASIIGGFLTFIGTYIFSK